MSLYVLDTDILTLFRHGHASVCQNVAAHAPTELALTILTVEEQLTGWYGLLRKVKQPAQWPRYTWSLPMPFVSSVAGRFFPIRCLQLLGMTSFGP